MIPFDPKPMIFYQLSIVTIGLSCTISEINGDLSRKSHFSPPLKGFVSGYRRKGSKTRMMGLPEPDCRKSCKIGLAVFTQYRRVTASQLSFDSKYRASKRRAGEKNKKLS